MTEKEIVVEVAYALPNEQLIIPIKVHEGITVRQAIQISAILSRFPEIDLGVNTVGIFGKPCSLYKQVLHLDRIEIYRPLVANPKEVRKLRAKLSGMKAK